MSSVRLVMLLLLTVATRAAWAQSPEGALLMESGRLTEVSGGNLGKVWCRAKFHDDGAPLVRCVDDAGRPQACAKTPGFDGLTMRIRDGLGFDYTYRWQPSQCDARTSQYIFCHGHCEADGTSGSCKATIRDYGTKRAPGWYDFKILPRELKHVPPGPYAGPFTCEVQFDHGRRWVGSLPEEECAAFSGPERLRCHHLPSQSGSPPA